MSLGPEMRRMGAAVSNGSINFDGASLPQADMDADARMAALRPELYAVTGLIAPFAVKQLISLKDTYPPYGVPKGSVQWGWIPRRNSRNFESWDDVASFNELYQGLTNSAQLAANDFTVSDEYRPVAERFNTLVQTAHEIDPKVPRYESPRAFILAGLNTAIEMSVGALSGIHALAKVEREPTSRQDFIEIAGRSSRLASVIAAVNIDHTGAVRRTVQTHDRTKSSDETKITLPYFNPNLLRFYPDPEAPDAYVDYIRPLDQLIDPWSGTKIGDLGTRFDTLTCPALPRFGKEDALVKSLWKHITGLSADIKFGKS